ncbi:ABC transporter ATP-binding protein [Demequina zhanjiangensis]|uniref:ABC transporter ATP-binding protein n=1 Tax=Demequina zhanjiangensis TaxID=3051659 RepID=A0ABT8G1E2_9MICO|nr:ABC transporter ATP-binding protein [Demequina sp. SYSU T00b26]MDN4472943.1 ABC transporter ATP-binding protein [Demequina sp. SYSU T00b26]
MTAVLEAHGLTKRFKDVTALADVSFSIDGPGVYGVLGRNGAGKTTLMNLLTGQDFPTSGTARLAGLDPATGSHAFGAIAFIKESQAYPEGYKGRHVLKAASGIFPRWDDAYAAQLIEDFGAPLDRHMKKLSRGQRSAVGAVVALASRAEVTLLDEPYAGLDAVARQLFYDRLLTDFAEHPRVILMSTHLIDEAADLFQRVLVIDKGRLVIDQDADELRGAAVRLVGPAAQVDRLVGSREVLHRETLGGTAAVTVDGADDAFKAEAVAAGLELAPVSLQQLIVRRTGVQSTEEISA